ncbi:hypothetical protein NE237_001761 [Protea cynaroides]|uniref:Uncharacterized protein n=1 Tax=Protea cynaroides TaxID=273540 RepID=A0A9Q0KTX8_9MAGN|nr:hypothetical protein NE237_001761 [Protea cynaroides]
MGKKERGRRIWEGDRKETGGRRQEERDGKETERRREEGGGKKENGRTGEEGEGKKEKGLTSKNILSSSTATTMKSHSTSIKDRDGGEFDSANMASDGTNVLSVQL